MRNRLMKSVHRPGRWKLAALCIVLVAPLTAGCNTASVVGFTAFNALYASFLGFAPLRSLTGGIVRDIFVSIF